MKYFKMNLSQLFNVTYMGQCKFDEDWVHFARRTDTYVLYFVKEGNLFIEEEGTKYHVKEGEYLLLEPNKFHVGYKCSAITYYFIHFTNSDFTCMGDYTLEMVEKDIVSRRLVSLASDITTSDYQEDSVGMIPKYHKLQNNFDIYSLLDAACYELNQKGENYKLYSILIANQVLIKMNRLFNAEAVGTISQKSYSTVKKLIRFLEANIENKIAIKEIEEYMDLNYNYLNRIFKCGTGFTIKHYLNIIRIQHAQKLIRETTLTFTEISERVGIDDPFYFSKLFKTKTGLTPTQYKKETYYADLE